MKKRNVVTAVILSLITCGLYGIYWYISITDDMGTLTRDERFSGFKYLLLSIITCGIFHFIWAYRMGEKTRQITIDGRDNSMLYLILSIFGLDLVIYILVQQDINRAIDNGLYFNGYQYQNNQYGGPFDGSQY